MAPCGSAAGVPVPPPPESSSAWTPEALASELERLPVSALFPELAADARGVLRRWHQRFPLKIWKRMVKVFKGAAHQTPCVLKELNESAPVICRVRSLVDALPRDSPPCHILDLGAGFGFLSMFLAELLPPERVSRCVLMDAGYPNRGVDASAGLISTEHIYGCGAWRIPLHTLKVDLKKGRALNQISERVIRAPASESAEASAPALVCGVHLCNTLSLRAAQLFNEHQEVVSLALVPCCFPTQRHVAQQVVYQLGSHRFAAEDFLSPAAVPSSRERFARWAEHILEGVEPGPGGTKALERHGLHKPQQGGMFAQDLYIFAERQWQGVRDVPIPRRQEPVGGAVIVDAEYGHAAARARAGRKGAPRGRSGPGTEIPREVVEDTEGL